MQQLQQAGVSAGVVRSIPRLMDDPHLRARGFWQQMERAHVGRYLSGSTPFRQDGRPLPIRQVAPTLGEHTAQVLAERLGLTPAQVDAMEQQGITGRSARPKTSRNAA
jgi:crotonobetainyl-CoA:carnitine CoA-transferase CaiB-like acyl-CoA transferase